MNPTCVDSFSGAGGLSIGLTRAGFDVLLSFDNERRCVETQLPDRGYAVRNQGAGL